MATSDRLSLAEIKKGGVHYTPPELASFLAKNVLAHVSHGRGLRILDPACGDGGLLEAVAFQLPSDIRHASTFFGMEHDGVALQEAGRRLRSSVRLSNCELIEADFLDWAGHFPQSHLFDVAGWPDEFDVVIANPPYVRTQVMGAEKSRRLAAQFGLSGRVDLYHPFALGMTQVLSNGGVLGLLCSNRFLSVQSGASLRKALLHEYELYDIYDLGDTKLFAAAVLPAIVIGKKCRKARTQDCRFTRVYEFRSENGRNIAEYPTVLSALDADAQGPVRVGNATFEIERGNLALPEHQAEPWRVSSPEQERWLATIYQNAPLTFADLVKIRVGIKTTADNVFIRSDWHLLPSELQPESELLLPVLSNNIAAPWWPMSEESRPHVLYTHSMRDGKRVTVNIDGFPRAKQYLESHRKQLAGRKYVIDAGRKWFEIWVPQNPGDWTRPKVVFSDISAVPKFFLDRSGQLWTAIVIGSRRSRMIISICYLQSPIHLSSCGSTTRFVATSYTPVGDDSLRNMCGASLYPIRLHQLRKTSSKRRNDCAPRRARPRKQEHSLPNLTN